MSISHAYSYEYEILLHTEQPEYLCVNEEIDVYHHVRKQEINSER